MVNLSSSIITGQEFTPYINKKNIRSPIHPAFLMLGYWAVICFIYFLGPIYLTPSPSFSTCLFIALHLLLFIVSSMVFSRVVFIPKKIGRDAYISYIPSQYINYLTFIILAVGLSGGLMSIYSKLSFLETINFSSITELREIRAQSLLYGAAVQSSSMSALAFLLYPAGFVGLVITNIWYEKIPLISKIMSFLFVLTIVLLTFCAGGRSPIMVLLLFIGASSYVRKKMGKSYTPNSKALRIGLASLVSLFLVYSSYIWIVRSQQSRLSLDEMLAHAANVWGAHPRTYLLNISAWLDAPGLVQSVLSSTFYFIQNLSISERLLSASDQVPTLYGAYQIDIFAAILRIFPGGSDYLREAYALLLNMNVYGFFTGAWTGLFIDLGWGSFLAVLLWGFFAGKSWISFKNNPNVLSGVMYVFWIYSVFISFVSSPVGFSNSFMIFFWFLFFALSSLVFTRYASVSKVSVTT